MRVFPITKKIVTGTDDCGMIGAGRTLGDGTTFSKGKKWGNIMDYQTRGHKSPWIMDPLITVKW